MPRHPAAVALKVGVDQLLMSPIGTALYLYHMQAMDGRLTVDGAAFKDKLVQSLAVAYKLWPLAHVLNFSMIPSRHRVLYINVVAVGWTTILARISQDDQPMAAPS